MDKELIFALSLIGTLLAAVLINLGLIYIAKGQSRSAGSTKNVIKSTIGGIRNPLKKDNDSLEELSNLVKAIKENEETQPETKDL